jgi:hypothetical protein
MTVYLNEAANPVNMMGLPEAYNGNVSYTS